MVFALGLLLWVATVAVGRVTHNVILLPTIVLLGSFLVPITAVVWYLDHDPSPALSPRRIVTAFLIGGVMGVLGASLLEYWLVRIGLIGAFEVGLIEEFVKAVFIVVVALGISQFHIRDGMVLGATVGFGFAALESSGYALASLFVVQGNQLILSLNSVIFTELVRGVLAPFGHGMWSAMLGGAIFAAARRGGLRVTWVILGTYLFVSALHGAFDSVTSIWGVAVVSLIGLIPFIWLWRRGDAGGVLKKRRPV
ncbi:MAG TPA: PrsW family glutamic-type intramembrane protease [Candidatus Dormibacteraeota bacterium]|nr:PrsW family glutamic-type intramembrane protease [Candidatus Dormibacteraeota bacterium]